MTWIARVSCPWVEFTGVIDPMDVAIPIDSTVTEMGKSHLGVGWSYSDGGITLVPDVFQPQAGAFRPVVHDTRGL